MPFANLGCHYVDMWRGDYALIPWKQAAVTPMLIINSSPVKAA